MWITEEKPKTTSATIARTKYGTGYGITKTTRPQYRIALPAEHSSPRFIHNSSPAASTRPDQDLVKSWRKLEDAKCIVGRAYLKIIKDE